MGGGAWSTEIFTDRDLSRKATGKSAFDYSDRARRAPGSAMKPHPSLDPMGVRVRESRDSSEHPTSLAIATVFDVTGSMGDIPVVLREKLPELNGLLMRKGYVEHPQIMFSAVGDATCDRVPLQVGQFESDNRMDENLENFVLEGGGGGQKTESYELALYFMARHTDIDCWNKRNHKGYLFVIGDEMAYGKVERDEVKNVIGDGLQQNIPIEEILAETNKRFETFYILPTGASHGGDPQVLGFWRRLLGQNVLELGDPEAVCETIALKIGITEGSIDLDRGISDLEEFGVSQATRQSVRNALTAKRREAGRARRL